MRSSWHLAPILGIALEWGMPTLNPSCTNRKRWPASTRASGVNGGGLQYAHESLAGADAIAAAGGGAGATATLAMSGGSTTSTAGAPRPIVKSERENVGRNDPCWCGSGKKFKKCHGA